MICTCFDKCHNQRDSPMRSQIMMARNSAAATSDSSGGSASPLSHLTSTAASDATTSASSQLTHSLTTPVTPGAAPLSSAFVRPWELDTNSSVNRNAFQHQQSQQLASNLEEITDTIPPLSAPPILTARELGAPTRSPPVSAFLYPPPQPNTTMASQVLTQLRAMAAAATASTQQQQASTPVMPVMPVMPVGTAPPVTPVVGNVDLQSLINAQQLQQQLMLLSQLQSAVLAANSFQHMSPIPTTANNIIQQPLLFSPNMENPVRQNTNGVKIESMFTQSDSGMSDSSPRSEHPTITNNQLQFQLNMVKHEEQHSIEQAVTSPYSNRNISGPHSNENAVTPQSHFNMPSAVVSAQEHPGSSSASSSASSSTHGNHMWEEEKMVRSPGGNSATANYGRRRSGKKDRNRPPPLVFADPRISNVQQCLSPAQHPPVLSPNTNLQRHHQPTPQTAPPIGVREMQSGSEFQSAFSPPVPSTSLHASSSCSLLNNLQRNSSAFLCTPATTSSSLSSFSTGSSIQNSSHSLEEQQQVLHNDSVKRRRPTHGQQPQATLWQSVWLCFGADVNIRLTPGPGLLHGTNLDCLPWHSTDSMRLLLPQPEATYANGLRLVSKSLANNRYQFHFANADANIENNLLKPVIIADCPAHQPFWCASRRVWCSAGGNGCHFPFDAVTLRGHSQNDGTVRTRDNIWQSLELGDIVASKLDAELPAEAKAPTVVKEEAANHPTASSFSTPFLQPLPPAPKFQSPHSQTQSTVSTPNDFVHNLAVQFAAAAAASQHQQHCMGGASLSFGQHRTPLTPSALFSPSLQLPMISSAAMLASPTTPHFLSPTQSSIAPYSVSGNVPQLTLTSDDPQQQQHQANVAMALTEWFNRARLTSPTVPGQPPLSPFLLAAAAAAHQHQQMPPMFNGVSGMCNAPPLGSPAAFSAGLGFGFMGGGPVLTPVSRNSHHHSLYKREPVSNKISGSGSDGGESSNGAPSSSSFQHHSRQRANMNGGDGSGSSRERDVNRSRRPMNAFMLFAKQHRTFYTKRYPGKDNRTISCMLGHHWKSLDTTQRREFAERAKVMAEDYKKVHPDCYKRNGVTGNKKRT